MMQTVLAICLLLVSSRFASAEMAELIEVSPEQQEALGIKVGPAQKRELVAGPLLPGRVTLRNDRVHLITARLSGVLVRLVAGVGDSVEAGQIVAHLESPDFVSRQREYLEARSQLNLARSTAERESSLAQSGIIAGRRAAQSKALLQETRAREKEHRQALTASGMQDGELTALRSSGRLASQLALRSPISGVVLEQLSQTGARLEAGTAVYRVGNAQDLLVEIHVPLRIAHSLRTGTAFRLPEQSASGQVIAVGTEVHPIDQGVLVRGEITEGAAKLSPGQFIRVEFATPAEGESSYLILDTALIHTADRAWVFRRVEHGFEPVSVRIIGGSGHNLIIAAPLEQDAHLATSGTASLKAHWLSSGGPN